MLASLIADLLTWSRWTTATKVWALRVRGLHAPFLSHPLFTPPIPVYRSCLHYCLAAACDVGGIHLSGRLDRWPLTFSQSVWWGLTVQTMLSKAESLSHIFTLMANLLERFNWESASFEYRFWVKTDCLDTWGMAGGKKSGYLCIFRRNLFS